MTCCVFMYFGIQQTNCVCTRITEYLLLSKRICFYFKNPLNNYFSLAKHEHNNIHVAVTVNTANQIVQSSGRAF